MEKYIILSPGRTASTSLRKHIKYSLNNLNIPNFVESAETPLLWLDSIEDPENWTVLVSTRYDMLAQTLSFLTVILTTQTHKTKDIPLNNFSVSRSYFFTFAYLILAFKETVEKENDWNRFKKVYWFNYEDIVKDWPETGRTLGFNDWKADSNQHALGYGRVWDRIDNKAEVLDWAREIQTTSPFTFNQEKYKL